MSYFYHLGGVRGTVISINGNGVNRLNIDGTHCWSRLTAPSISTHPVANVTISDDVSYTLTITATSNYPDSLTYQWFKDNVAVGGATSRTLTVSNLSAGTHRYYCRVSNEAGTVNSNTSTITSVLSLRDLAGVKLVFPSIISGAPGWKNNPSSVSTHRVTRSGVSYTSAEGLTCQIEAYYIGRTWIPATAYVAGYWADSSLSYIRATPINCAGKYSVINGVNVAANNLRTDRPRTPGVLDIYSTEIAVFFKRP